MLELLSGTKRIFLSISDENNQKHLKKLYTADVAHLEVQSIFDRICPFHSG